jgi:hypothetical protein
MPVWVRGRRGVRVGLVVVGAVVLLLALAQLILPAIAVKLVRDRISRYGTVKSASISAFPAIELLWGKAESATLVAGHLQVTAAQLAEITAHVWEARGVEKATVSAEQATVSVSGLASGLHASDIHASKRGSQISGGATVTQQALDEAAPGGFHIQPLASGNGEVEVRATGALFGTNTSISALIKPLDGRLVVEPQGLPFGGFTSVTLLSVPHLDIESVAMEVAGHQPLAYRLSIRASLR